MSELHRVLRGTYFECWRRRNKLAAQLGELRDAVNVASNELAGAQSWLETVGAEWKASGDVKADDYLTRVWPVVAGEEHPSESE